MAALKPLQRLPVCPSRPLPFVSRFLLAHLLSNLVFVIIPCFPSVNVNCIYYYTVLYYPGDYVHPYLIKIKF